VRIEALEIDDHILDKIEARHSVSFQEVEEAAYSGRRHVRRGRLGLYRSSPEQKPGVFCLLYWLTREKASGRSLPRA
jgi:hypothetical protein